jgi:hypothetical protein
MSMRSVILAIPWRGVTALACFFAIFVCGGPVFADKGHAWSSYVPTIVLIAFGIALGLSAMRSRVYYERVLGLASFVAGALLAVFMAEDSLESILRY